MKITTKQDLINHLKILGVEYGDDVVVHTKLAAFGLIKGRSSAVLEAIRSVVGEQATVAVPTYCFDGGEVYDPRTTPSTRVGAFSEYIRTLPGAVRSASPIHSHAAVGPKADLLTQTPPTVTMGPGSDFEKFYTAKFKLLLLGCEPDEGATYLHHLEALAAVPYREWIVLNRQFRNASGEEQSIEIKYFARKDLPQTKIAFNRALKWMAKFPSYHAAEAPYGKSYAFLLSDLHDKVLSMIVKDPYALVDVVE